MRCVSYMRRDSYWRDERSDYHKSTPKKKGDYGYYDLDGDLIAQQRAHIRDYAEELGWSVEEEYIDLEGRDEFDRLKRNGFSRKFDCVITDSFYRFSDRMGDAKVTIQHIFIPVGIQVAIAQDKFCSLLSTDNETDYYFRSRSNLYAREGSWEEKARRERPAEGSPDESPGKTRNWQGGGPVFGSFIHDGENGEVLRYAKYKGRGVLYRPGDTGSIKWELDCPAVSFDGMLEIVAEAIRREKSAAERAKEQLLSDAAERNKEELLAPLKTRAKTLMEETETLLAERFECMNCNCEEGSFHDRRVWEDRDDKHLARLDEEFNEVMEKAKWINTVYSLSNSWITRFAGLDMPEKLTNRHIRLFIADIIVYGMGRRNKPEEAENPGEQNVTGNPEGYSVKVIVRDAESRRLLPAEWLPEHTYSIPDIADDDAEDNEAT